MSSLVQLMVVGPEWAARFAAEHARIAAALGTSALDIQHIGSTAIPGLVAKPILAIAIAIRDFESGHALVPALIALGFAYRVRTAFHGDTTSSGTMPVTCMFLSRTARIGGGICGFATGC